MIIQNKYEILQALGSGSFGTLYQGRNLRTNTLVAIKVERIREGTFNLLANETRSYRTLKGIQGIPEVRWFGKDDQCYYMVIDLLGGSLQHWKEKVCRFSLSLTLKIGIKVISLLRSIHEKGFVHRDVKPDNFLFGRETYNSLYIVDFGFSTKYSAKAKQTHGLIGSNTYASIHSHERMSLTRRDDMESCGYMLWYLWKGELPWQSLTTEADVYQCKKTTSFEIPFVIRDFILEMREMGYADAPRYQHWIYTFERKIQSDTSN